MSLTVSTSSTGTNRIVGMASGLDVDAIVKSMMATDQSKVDAMNQQKTLLGWKTDAYNTVKTSISDFTSKYLSTLSPDSVISASAFDAKNIVTSSDQYATITAGTDASDGAYTINSITSLASGADVESTSNNISTSTALKNLTLNTPLTFVNNKLDFSINGQNFDFNSTDSLQKVINTVNSNSAAGVTMSYSSLSGKISIKSKTTGSGTDFAFSDTNGNFFSAFGFTEVSKGTDAVLKINNYDVVQKSNSFTIDGINYNLLRTTDNGTSVDFSVSQDVDTIYNKINNFVNAYNTLIADLNSKVSEPKYSTYLPLTDTQKAAMNDTEITEWETKAKSGLLNSNDDISNLLLNIRNAFSQTVQGAGISSFDLGITTGDYTEEGKLYVDETKLKAAIANNPQAVTNLFTSYSVSTNSTTKFNESGIAERINDSMNSYTNFLNTNTLPYTASQISDYSDRVTTALDQMTTKENAYYTKYSNLETALSKMNAQSSSLSALLGNSSSSSN